MLHFKFSGHQLDHLLIIIEKNYKTISAVKSVTLGDVFFLVNTTGHEFLGQNDLKAKRTSI